MLRVWIGFNWFKKSTVSGSNEYDIERLVSIKVGEFLDQLNDYRLFKSDSAS